MDSMYFEYYIRFECYVIFIFVLVGFNLVLYYFLFCFLEEVVKLGRDYKRFVI